MLRNRFRIARAAATLWAIAVAVQPLSVNAQALTAEAIVDLAEAHHDDAIRLYREFLRLPNDAAYHHGLQR